MRKNPVKAALAAGKRAYGAMVFEFFSPGIAQICRNAGAEFVLYDMEHTGLSFETLKLQFALCRGLDVVPMVRVPRGEYHFIARALDVGAMGVMVPMVGTAEEAAHIVACTRYPPAGRRGAAFGFAHDDYQGGDVAAKIAAIHERTLVIPQIETVEGLNNVEAIGPAVRIGGTES
ncbi:MAG: aldolase/citrate lyase family protein, partial [Casimicrobiaceae bacterium]